ncbi:MAG: hypothetical protein RMH84_03485 [Sulfolobales archaeon]|nr:hypothetical protein [Sulfolobales archaeon]MCX8208433.1 hypothetical protein [Sulfolobales archaeon]MDW8010638.1 hypothetical protein [Sulfolobales archaeon]
MSDVLSIRIPRELKAKMRELDVNWKDEIVKFLAERVEYYRRLKVVKEVRKIVENIPRSEPGTAARYVREDRDSN